MNTISRPNGVTTDYSYDARHRLTEIIHGSFATGDPHTFSYSYDNADNALQLIETQTGATVTTTWQYDDAYRLLTETTDRSGISLTTSYVYDAMGNRLTEKSGTEIVEYTYNELDQLISDSTSNYTYDARGNLIPTDKSGVVTTFSYDAQDRLIGINIPTVGNVDYAYDHRGQRVRQTTTSETINYLWDEFTTYGNILYEYDDSDQQLTAYTYLDDILLAQIKNTETHYLLTDRLNSTHALVDSTGVVTDTYAYSAFGELVEQVGTTENDYLFTGQQFDEISNLYNLRARYYDPATGRFISQDTYPYNFENPVELNRYVYTANNPVNLIDLSGLAALPNYSSSHKLVFPR